jgi:acetyl-CoA carboxylase carboxyl transferase subunit beta
MKEELPPGFQQSEFVKDHGGIDLVCERKNLRSKISTLLSILLKKKEGQQTISETSDVTTFDKTLQKTSKAI